MTCVINNSIVQIPLSENEIRRRLTATAIETIQTIVKDNGERMAGYKDDPKLLDSGIFYANRYFMALQELNQIDCLEHHVERGDFYHGLAPATHFCMQSDGQQPTQVVPERFLLKRDVKPSEALEAMRKGPSLIDCGATCQIGYYEALREVLGTEKFDMLFAADSPTPLMIHLDTLDSPLDSLLTKTVPAKKIVKGQIVPIANVGFYQIKHIRGDSAGYIALCSDDTPGHHAFTTLGLLSEGERLEQVWEKLLAAFNSEPISVQVMPKDVADRFLEIDPHQGLATTTLTPKEFILLGGGLIGCTVELNAARITELANSSFAEARRLLNHWHRG